MNQDTLFYIYNQLPFEMKLMIAKGVEMEYKYNYEDNKVTVKTKNKVGITWNEKDGYIIAERKH